MNRNHKLPLPALLLAALVAAPAIHAQSTAQSSSVQDAKNLAQYDTNHNGKLDPNEVAAMQADQARAAAAGAAAPAGVASDQPVQLSPFEINESNNGYYATNTMSGTRLNTKIEDLGSSISVVTKAQMSDFAMLDINDVFNYEANTEGTGNFTDFSIDRNGMVTDNIQNNPQGANRVRGIGPANIALGNYATSGRVPVDPINIDGIEISRGPNSSIFGLGQGSGTVNLLPSTASLNRESSTTEARVDSLGGYRTSLDVNRPIFRNLLALRASAVYQHDAYNEKPSGTTTRRYNIMLRAQPFKYTSVKASFQSYDLYGTRASTITPRDTVSYWKSIGSPTWDPIASAVTVNGVTTVTGSVNPTGLGPPSFADPVLFVDQNGLSFWEIGHAPQATATNGPNNTSGNNRLLETIAPPVKTAGHPLYSTVPGISDKNLFDWSSINLAGINSIMDHNEMSTVELEQTFLQTERQTLAAQGGWNRENASRFNKNMIGQSSATGNSNYLYVDVNKNLLDGRPNPYFMRPYLGVGEPVFSSQPYQRDTFRGQLAYKLDFTNEKNWMKWLGRHSIVGYQEERLTKTYSYRFRDVNLVDNPIYAPAGTPKGNQSATGAFPVGPIATRPYFHYYVGDANGQNVDYAPTAFQQGQYTFNWFNPLANAGNGAWVGDPATLGESGITEGTAGNFGLENLIRTRGIILQDSILNDRIVFTGGQRHDDNNNKFQKPSALLPNGYTFDYAAMNGFVNDTIFKKGPWALRSGDTTQKGGVVKPFRGWARIDSMAGEGGAPGFFANLLRGMTFFYNKSDSFVPDNPAISVTLEQLTNPTSNDKEYGFSFNLWDDKLVVRVNHYITNSINTKNGQFGTFGQRVLRVDYQAFAGNNDAISLERQARDWILAANPAFTTAQVDAEMFKETGLNADTDATFRANTIGETQDISAKGDELELNFNPDRYWTLKITGSKTESTNANIAPHITTYVAQRTPTWTTIIDPRNGLPWFTNGYSGDTVVAATASNTPQAFLQTNIVAPILLAQALEGKDLPEIRKWHYNLSGSLRLAKYTEQQYLKNVSIGGSVRWESKGAIGYYGIPVNGDISAATAYDPNRPIYVKANTYFDGFGTYTTRLFHDKIRTRFQLNLRNIQEWKAHLEPVGAFPDGTPHTFRIVEPMSAVFTTTFDL